MYFITNHVFGEIAAEKHADWLCVELALIFHCYTGSGYGYTSHHVSARLSRQFTVLRIPTLTDDSLCGIYSHTMQSVLDKFPPFRFEHRAAVVEVVLTLMSVTNSIFVFFFHFARLC